MGIGIISLLQALILEAPAFINLKDNDPVTNNAIKAFAEAIFHNLLIANLVIGIVCIVAAISSKIYAKKHLKLSVKSN